MMQRRTFLQFGLFTSCVRPLVAALDRHDFDAAAQVLEEASESGQVRAASLLVRHRQQELSRSFGACTSEHDVFLIASISKPMSAAAVMTLYAEEKLALDDSVTKFLPEFGGDRRVEVTIGQLLTHVSGLPDQLPENESLRKRHAPLEEFVQHAVRTPLLFGPGEKYSYSSMGILLAAEIAQRVTGQPFHQVVKERVFDPIGMENSALGLGEFKLNDLMQCQVEDAAPESGAGDPSTKQWDWNSRYWRSLGSPWGGVHSTARDIAKFLDEFIRPGKIFSPELARLMIRNRNPDGMRPRGIGFALGSSATSPSCSEETFGHGGSTGTLAWADPVSDTTCVVLTTLPGRAANPHPRQRASDLVAKTVAKS